MTHKHQQKPLDKKTATERPDSDQLHNEIEQLAYKLYCECGYEHGHDLKHWAEAERRILERHRGKSMKGE